jgi:hypothetical protein
MVTISATLREKITRRSVKAFRRFDEGEGKKVHRISGVTKDLLKYRISRRRSKSVDVARKADGTIVVDPPTTGLIDLQKTADIERLKNHAGEIHGYLRVRPKKKTYAVGDQINSQFYAESYEQMLDKVKGDDKVYKIESHADDIDKVESTKVHLNSAEVVEEINLAKLGFTTGLYDCLTKADVVKMKKKKHLGKVRAYKYTTKDAKSPTRTGKEAITYKVGENYEIKDANTDPGSNCHKGVNVADVEWAKRSASGGNRLFAFEFEAEDIAAIPTNTDGKFRVHRCKCVEELDPKTLKPIKPVKKDPPKPKDDKPKTVEEAPSKEKTKKVKKPKKRKKGFFDKLLGRDDD